jgi:RNA polymerase sigma factor (sigma-70 family)
VSIGLAGILYLLRYPPNLCTTPVADQDKRAFVAQIEKQHGASLRRFLASRLRNAAADLPDLAQEVFLRLLRAKRHDTIRSPEAYLITIASHVLHQHALGESTQPDSVKAWEVEMQEPAGWESDPLIQVDLQQRIARLESSLKRLSPRAQATLVMHRRDGLSLDQIGRELGVSRSMAKKYLAQALAHCRKRLGQTE